MNQQFNIHNPNDICKSIGATIYNKPCSQMHTASQWQNMPDSNNVIDLCKFGESITQSGTFTDSVTGLDYDLQSASFVGSRPNDR